MATVAAPPLNHHVLDFLGYREFERGLSRNTLEAYLSHLLQFGAYLERQEVDVLELPAGIMDVEGEEPEKPARRELEEELGLSADTWSHAITFYSSSGFTNEQVHIYCATGLERVGEADADGHERIEVVTWPIDEIDELIDENADAKTLVGLLWLRRRMGERLP